MQLFIIYTSKIGAILFYGSDRIMCTNSRNGPDEKRRG